MLAVLAGHDESDACSVDRPVDDYVGALTGDVSGLRIGVDSSFLNRPDCDPDVASLARAALEVFKGAGAVVGEVSLPLYQELTTATMAGLQAEALSYHRKDLQARWGDYGYGTRMAIGTALLMTGADYVQAQRVRRVGVRLMAELLADYDILITPTCLVPPPMLASLGFGELISSLLTPYWNAVGNPAMSSPMGLTRQGLPVGLQLAGRPFEETTVFRAADAFQRVTDHHLAESTVVKELLA
jgi:aspartyl-tRNA(Asn)/glutamyl-tRNA(Gln) amidotransferase subunit A